MGLAEKLTATRGRRSELESQLSDLSLRAEPGDGAANQLLTAIRAEVEAATHAAEAMTLAQERWRTSSTGWKIAGRDGGLVRGMPPASPGE
jgi:hypothetical protein